MEQAQDQHKIFGRSYRGSEGIAEVIGLVMDLRHPDFPFYRRDARMQRVFCLPMLTADSQEPLPENRKTTEAA